MAPGVHRPLEASHGKAPVAGPRPGLVTGGGSTAEAGGFRDGPRCPMLLAQTCALLALTGSMVLPLGAVDGNVDAPVGCLSQSLGTRPGEGALCLSPDPQWDPSTLSPTLGPHLPGQQSGALHLDLSRADVDECATGQAQCAHGCLNTRGSFTCLCHAGYELGADGRQCYREWAEGGRWTLGWGETWEQRRSSPGPTGTGVLWPGQGAELSCQPGAVLGVGAEVGLGCRGEGGSRGRTFQSPPSPGAGYSLFPSKMGLGATGWLPGSGSTMGGGHQDPIPHPYWRVLSQVSRWRL